MAATVTLERIERRFDTIDLAIKVDLGDGSEPIIRQKDWQSDVTVLAMKTWARSERDRIVALDAAVKQIQPLVGQVINLGA